MASTLEITFQVQALDFSPLTRGRINIHYNGFILDERLTQNVPTTNYFREVTWSGSDTEKNNEQAVNFATAFNRDYRNVGGTRNLGAKVTGNVVTITAQTGTFDNSTEYTGNVLIVGFNINNSTAPPNLLLDISATNNGDCDTIEYSATLTNGVAPYELTYNGAILETSWDGSQTLFNLPRGTQSKIVATDSGTYTEVEVINVPRKLSVGEFKERFTQFDGYSDITIDSVNPVSGTTPVTYALSDTDGGNQTAFQESNSFPGVLVGSYTLYVRDRFGCELTKTIVVTEFSGGIEDKIAEYFLIAPHNSIAFEPKNKERLNLKYKFTQEWGADEIIGTQFKSSFPYHNITLIKDSGQKIALGFSMIQENLGFVEKTDAVLFEINDKTGVYFAGGNSYEPNTETVIDASPYNGFRPSWAVVGRGVSIDLIGSHIIDSIGFDTERQKYFFTIDTPYTGTLTDTNTKVQVTHNIHDYNLFECYINMGLLNEESYFLFEYGYSENEIVGFEKSIKQKPLSSNCKHSKFVWYDQRNRRDMVFQSGIKGYMNLQGDFFETSITSSELAQGDDGSYDLVQSARSGWKLKTDLLPPEIWKKLDIATGCGKFFINDILLKRSNSTRVSEIGETNLREYEAEFDYGVDNLAIKDDEFVLNLSNGVEGGGGTGKSVTGVTHDGQIRLVDESGNFFTIGGNLIAIG